MGLLVACVIINISGVVGIILDIRGITKDPPVFWMLGSLTGFAAGVFGVVLT